MELSKEQKLRSASQFICSAENHGKNAVCLLLEVAAHVGEKVTFQPAEKHGLSLNKMFTCVVKFGSLLSPCKAIGMNKKMAKLSAAEQALEMLKADESSSASSSELNSRRQQSNPNFLGSRKLQISMGPSSLMSPGDWSPDSPQSASNPIGELQEMAKDYSWAPPSYNVIHEQGQAHDKTFVVECKIDDLVSQGEGRSKKVAKRVSAENMLSMIRESERVNKKDNTIDDEVSPRARTPELEPLPKSLRTASATRPSKLPGASALRLSFGSSFLFDGKPDTMNLSELKSSLRSDQNQSVKHTVESLKERGFSIKYHDLPEMGYSGNYLCFVELGTSPPAVCCGSGVTKDAAHANAAHNALQYLDTMGVKGTKQTETSNKHF